MSRFRGRDEIALLGRVADSPGIALVPGLREEVRRILSKAREPSSVEPEFRTHVSDVVGKTSDALASYANEQRATLQRDLLECAAHLPQADREKVFRRLWESEKAGAAGRLDQVRAIDEARKLLDESKQAAATDSAGPGVETTPVDDPEAKAGVRRDLESAIEKGERVRSAAPALPPVARELFEAALAGARTALQTETMPVRALAEMTEVLETLASSLHDENFAAALSPPSRSRDAGQTRQQIEAASELRKAIASATEELDRLAASLPTARVVRSRTRLSEAEASAYSGDPDAMKRSLDELGKDTEEIRRLAEQQRRFEEDRSAAEADRLAAEIERLAEIARRGDAKRLATLSANLKQRQKRAGVAAALPGLTARIENKERLDLAIRFRRASGCSEKARGQMQAELDRAKEALSSGDLAAIHEASSGLDQALRKTAPWRGPRSWVAGGVLLVVVLAAGVLGLRTLGQGTTTATFEFEPAAGVDTMKFVLVRGGEIVAERSVSPGQSVDISLPAGRFEVFVNDRYTGRVVRVPQDVGSIDPIPVPQ